MEEVYSENIEESFEPYDYKGFSTIKLLHSETGEIEELNFDTYLYGVVSAEMPASYEIEALKAQAIVARTYTIFQMINSHKHEDANICDNPACCQAWISQENRLARWDETSKDLYWNKIVQCVNDTSGTYITYNTQPINAFFHSNSGGQTESPLYVWGGDYPYLKSVPTSGEENYSGYTSEVLLSKDELIQIMLSYKSEFSIDFSSTECIKITELTESNRVKNILIGNINLSGTEARKLFNLKSTKFTVNIIDDTIQFVVTGYGHGVGLSQSGSDSLAKQGYNFEQIIKHFYTGVELNKF